MLQEGLTQRLKNVPAQVNRVGSIATVFFTDRPVTGYAAGQAILAVQARAGTDVAPLAGFTDPNSTCCALAERAFVRTLDGGCTSPVAAYAQLMGDDIEITGLYVSPDETVLRRGTTRGPKEQAEALGRGLALELKGECP